MFTFQGIRRTCLNILTTIALWLKKCKAAPRNDKEQDQELNQCMKGFLKAVTTINEWSKNHKLHWRNRKDLANAIKEILGFENLENFDSYADIFLRLVKDEDYRVRVLMSKAITVFFVLFED